MPPTFPQSPSSARLPAVYPPRLTASCVATIVAVVCLHVLACRPTVAQQAEPNLPRTPRFARLGEVLSVTNGSQPRARATVSLALDPRQPLPADWCLFEIAPQADGSTRETPVPAQLDQVADGSRSLWFVVDASWPPLAERQFVLRTGTAPPSTRVTVDQSPTSLTVRHGDSLILRYNKSHVVPPQGIDPGYGRSAHIHPVWTPRGHVVTDEFPPDHAHQSGVFLAYTKTRFEGREPNFWELLHKKGRVRFANVISVTEGPVFAQFIVHQEHVDETAVEPKVALHEIWQVRVWHPTTSLPNLHTWDITSTLSCATNSPLELPRYHYGGMAIRGARDWGGDRGQFLTSDGKDRIAGNHSRPQWCDLTGPVNQGLAGLALFTHSSNFRYPEPLRIHPTMPYMVYTPSHLGDWRIAPAQSHVSRYRLVSHDGELPPLLAAALSLDFLHPLVAHPR